MPSARAVRATILSICSSPSAFWFLPATNSRLASIKRTSFRSASGPPASRRRSKMRIAAGMPVPKKRLAGRPMTASSRFSSISAWRILPSRRPAEQHAVRHDHADAARARQGRLDHVQDEGVVALALGRDAAEEAVELVACRRPCPGPHLSRLNGGLATTTSNFMSESPSRICGSPIVSPQRTSALSLSCRNMFIRASAQVLPFASWP